MKLHPALLFIPLFMACSTTAAKPSSDPSGLWHSEPATPNPPLILRLKNGQISLENGCNRPSAHYTHQSDTQQLHINGTRATLMMCEAELMQRDKQAATLYHAEHVQFDAKNQYLIFKTPDGTHRFIRQE